ncbi:Threonine--tRNA ligase editing subunit [Metallosphaera sp. J1]|uniref:threonyl-tRNA synthetase editing domain-containing protein n=1 Tax=Metallosphaera javensis (ex Hofmann et al. 2022) TaxID=99938 RepID=UPI001EE0EEB4|nr:threonyl-tRNA synthetase editing domain-containing protein [Metallosphaera javensis (ex Hofmann et al. 2022)]MCG3109562.1 Threonine--tRNA ligase editing subunit [Metallosphaera javensis (ex Hofmann et al. 2022)]
MILLFIHASSFSFEVKQKALEIAEDPNPGSFSSQNTLVTFVSVEKGDDQEILERALENVRDVMNKTRPDTLVLYPYAHLSSNLADPRTAIQVLNSLYERLRTEKEKVIKAPFGWYKAFTVSCYGHPLSELSRRITKAVEYQKSKEMEVCSKFGFPGSPESTFMKMAVLERIKRDSGVKGIIYGETNTKGFLSVRFTRPEGRALPCVNEDPRIEVVYESDRDPDFPREFQDSTNKFQIWNRNGDKVRIDVGLALYYILLKAREKQTPTLPLWLSPVHVRILKVREEDNVEDMVNSLSERGIRVQVDDLEDGLGNKIRRAGMDWIPFVAIVGERELKTGNLTVRIRETSEQKPMTLDEIERAVKSTDDLLLPSNLPVSLKERLSNEKG